MKIRSEEEYIEASDEAHYLLDELDDLTEEQNDRLNLLEVALYEFEDERYRKEDEEWN